MTNLIVRAAEPSDFENILLLLKELWPNYNTPTETVRNIFSEGLNHNRSYYFVAASNSIIVGFLSITITQSLQSGKIAAIDEFIISKKHRRQGIGTQMLNCIELFVKTINCKSLELHSGLKRKESHLFYENRGFDKASYFFCKKIN